MAEWVVRLDGQTCRSGWERPAGIMAGGGQHGRGADTRTVGAGGGQRPVCRREVRTGSGTAAGAVAQRPLG